ncbi:neurogenic locus notch homolog protein 1 [Patella vulgata]|uniref:neurogenic locus notch homolog protein 1 n=1 Tax=Patella vulgata TaxID=6465 RepID=UPI0024A801B3|nr:neurogenic locus notch homolog protein 1 [Patella vulgata]
MITTFRLIVRSLRIFGSPIPEDELTKQLETCDITIKDEPILSFDNLDSVQSSDIEITIPSSCDAYDDCLSSPCNNHTCINEQGGFTCQCKDGYTGTTCNIPPDYCVNNLCENDAICQNSLITKNNTCNCKPGYKGRLCSYEIVNGGWSDWSEWSQCSVTCNGGNKTRQRTCTNPSPDEDGLNCTGGSMELLDCNIEHCPECHEGNLTLANGVAKAECTGDKDDMICSPICQIGFVFKDIIPSYECKGGDWLSGNKTEPCTKPVIPEEYKVNLGLSYKIPDCDSQYDVQNQIVQITDQLPCSTNPDCTLNVTINSCLLEPAPTLALGVSINIPINQSTIDFQPGNGTDDVTRALDTLDRTSQILQDDDAIFNVIINGVNYTSDMDVVGTIKCPPGTVQANGICVECSPGEYYKEDDDVCEYCALGTYQPDIGQTFCYNCPDGLMTQFIGSDRLSDLKI